MKTILLIAAGAFLVSANIAAVQSQPASSPAQTSGQSCPMADAGMGGGVMGAGMMGPSGTGNMQQMHDQMQAMHSQMHDDMQAMHTQMAAMHDEMQAMHQEMVLLRQAMPKHH